MNNCFEITELTFFYYSILTSAYISKYKYISMSNFSSEKNPMGRTIYSKEL